MSDTPRTDAEQWTPKKGEFPIVDADFARELERELAAKCAYAEISAKDAQRWGMALRLGWIEPEDVAELDELIANPALLAAEGEIRNG